MIKMYFDGGLHGPIEKKGQTEDMRLGVVFEFPDGKRREFVKNHIGYGTNNQAEWFALIWGLTLAEELGIEALEIFGDSQLIVEQANERWQVRKQELQTIKLEFDYLKEKFSYLNISHVYRNKNLAGILLE